MGHTPCYTQNNKNQFDSEIRDCEQQNVSFFITETLGI